MNTEQLYQRRLARYVTAMRNEKPDCVPIRPFVAEFTAKYAGYTCQEVTHDYTKAFDAAVSEVGRASRRLLQAIEESQTEPAPEGSRARA